METFGAPVDGEDDDFVNQQPDQGDDFMSNDDDFLHQQTGQGEEEDYFMSDDDDDYRSAHDDSMSDDDDEEYPFPVHAPPAAASEAAIVALEAVKAPADDCCPVCLQDGEVQEPAARPWSRVAPCGHRFHAACVDRWLRVKLSCPVCRCPAAPAAACRRDAAPEPPRPRPIPDIVEEFLAMGYEESLVFEKSPRWMEYMDDPYRHVT